MKTNYFNTSIFPLVPIFFYLIQTTYAQTPNQKNSVENHSWTTGNYFVIHIEDSSSNKQTVINTIHNPNNLSIQLEGKETGNLKLIDGKTLITQGIDSSDQLMIDKLDIAAITTQLAIKLLEIAAPEGSQLNTTKQVNINEKNRLLTAGTMSASMAIPPPWELKGTVTPSKTGVISFNFTLYAQNQTILVNGQWEKRIPTPQMDNSMLLSGWRMYTLGARTFKEGKSTIMDYGTTEIHLTAKTLGELKQSLSKK